MILSVLSLLYIGVTTKKTETKFYMAGFTVILAYGIFYFQNRLLYSMCVGSLKEGMNLDNNSFNNNNNNNYASVNW